MTRTHIAPAASYPAARRRRNPRYPFAVAFPATETRSLSIICVLQIRELGLTLLPNIFASSARSFSHEASSSGAGREAYTAISRQRLTLTLRNLRGKRATCSVCAAFCVVEHDAVS